MTDEIQLNVSSSVLTILNISLTTKSEIQRRQYDKWVEKSDERVKIKKKDAIAIFGITLTHPHFIFDYFCKISATSVFKFDFE